ncbi:MAG: intradiol ring-cleavage dioxygenase [Granulosicoccus sp.]
MTIERQSRRSWIARVGALLGSAVFFRTGNAAVKKTPAATEGPFYPELSMRPTDTDNDLVKVEGVVTEAGGEVVTLKGKVTDKNGKALSGHRVEIWQCDVNGKYLHTGDSQGITFDEGFQGFGHDLTNDNGEYSFRTIKPTKYPGRTQHIHVKVCIDDKELLTTQFYIDGEPNNQKDRIFRRLSSEEVDAVSMTFVQNDGRSEAVVDIVV